MRDYVEQLKLRDDGFDEETQPNELPSGDELAKELERFLRNRGADKGRARGGNNTGYYSLRGELSAFKPTSNDSGQPLSLDSSVQRHLPVSRRNAPRLSQ